MYRGLSDRYDMACEVVSFSIVLRVYAPDSGVARCDTTRNHDKSRDPRNVPVLETHSSEHLPKCVVLYVFGNFNR
jgi:hypothetical protein